MNKLSDAIETHLRGARTAQDAAAVGLEAEDTKRAARKRFSELRRAVIYPAMCEAHDAIRKFNYRARCHFDQPGRFASDGELPAVLEIDRDAASSARMGRPLDCTLIWCLEVGPPARVRVEWHGVAERQGLGQDVIHFPLEELTAETVSAQVLDFVRVGAQVGGA